MILLELLTELILMNLIAQKPSANPIPVGYQLVWNTEFDVAGKPDQNRWTFASGFVRNQELQPDFGSFCSEVLDS